MPDPQLKFDREELTLTITGLGGGWSLGQLGQLSLFDSAQVQWPSSWSQFKIAVATEVIQTQWQFNSRLVLEQTLEAGVEFTRKDGIGSSLQLSSELKYHLMERPTTQLDLVLKGSLDGKYDGTNFEGSGQIGVFLRGKF